MIPLKLNDLVDKDLGIFKKDENIQDKIKYCTVKEFIDNPLTIENWRFNNSYGNILYDNEVYEYVDTLHFDETACKKRKKIRDNQKNI